MAFHDSCLLSPEIPTLVQSLSVSGGALRDYERTGKTDAELRTRLEEVLLRHPLPNVQALRIELGSVYTDSLSDIPTPLLSYSLTSLTLKASFLSSHLLQLLGYYPALRHLDVSTTRLEFSTEEEEVHLDVVLSIEDLSVCNNVLRFCLGKQLFAVHTLRSIKLASFPLTELHECQRLLQNPKGALQKLHICLPFHG
ncbi:hypothetical protein F5146DRAFT_1224578, partial [Armillaria mellea]